jgi:hypothetical protein
MMSEVDSHCIYLDGVSGRISTSKQGPLISVMAWPPIWLCSAMLHDHSRERQTKIEATQLEMKKEFLLKNLTTLDFCSYTLFHGLCLQLK